MLVRTPFFYKSRDLLQEFQVKIIDPNDSPWKNEIYLGHMMTQEEARASSLKETLFHIVDHIVLNIQEINDYLGS